MTALPTALRATLVAAAAALALTACDRSADDGAASGTATGTTDTQAGSTATGGNTSTPGTPGAASAPDATTGATTPATTGSTTAGGATSGSAATSSDAPAAGGATGSGTGTAGGSTTTSPEDTIAANPTAAGSSGSGPTGAQLAAADRSFIEAAAGTGLYEVAVAKLAADKATDPAVKSYATMLVDHHTAANDKIKQVAGSHDIELPSTLPAAKQKVIEKLSKAESGPAFDREFVQTVGIKDHKSDIALFEKASRSAKDPEIKSFAESTLPTLREHLSTAQKLPGKKG